MIAEGRAYPTGHCHPLSTHISWSLPLMLDCQHSLAAWICSSSLTIPALIVRVIFCHSREEPILFVSVNQIMAKWEPNVQLLACTFKLVTTPQLYFPSLFFLLSSFTYPFILSCMFFFFYKQFQISFGSKCSVSTVIARMRRKEREINSWKKCIQNHLIYNSSPLTICGDASFLLAFEQNAVGGALWVFLWPLSRLMDPWAWDSCWHRNK